MLENVQPPCDARFAKHVLHECCAALSDVGFTRYRKEDVDWPLDASFHCWVGLNVGLDRDCVMINPFVGVHAVTIMNVYTWLEGRKYSRSTATYAIHLGKLAPKVAAFGFTRQTNVQSEAKRLAELYGTTGLTYAASIASYDQLLSLLEERVESLGGYPERFASCLYLMGRKDEARSFVKDFLKIRRSYFEGFALPFLKLLTH